MTWLDFSVHKVYKNATGSFLSQHAKTFAGRSCGKVPLQGLLQKELWMFNCSNVGDIDFDLKNVLGKGVTKHVFYGKYKEKAVAIKMVTSQAMDVSECLTRYGDAELWRESHRQCYIFPNMKLMKEILLLHQLNHPNLIKLLGYCVRSEETEQLSLKEHGVIAIYEYAKPAAASEVYAWSLETRLKSALELADLLAYLEHSPLGSLILGDLKRSHLLLRPPYAIVINDLDDAHAQEPECLGDQPKIDARYKIPGAPAVERSCLYDLPCIKGRCIGHNAKHNLAKMHSLILSKLLSCRTGIGRDPNLSLEQKIKAERAVIISEVANLCKRLQMNKLSALQLHAYLKGVISRL